MSGSPERFVSNLKNIREQIQTCERMAQSTQSVQVYVDEIWIIKTLMDRLIANSETYYERQQQNKPKKERHQKKFAEGRNAFIRNS